MRLQGHESDSTPRIIAAGGVTLIDFPAWNSPPVEQEGRELHLHNRLVATVALTPDEREQAAEAIARRVNRLAAPKAVILTQGLDEWDKSGGPFHDPEGLERFNRQLAEKLDNHAAQFKLDAHINDQSFTDTALAILDDWIEKGVVNAS